MRMRNTENASCPSDTGEQPTCGQGQQKNTPGTLPPPDWPYSTCRMDNLEQIERAKQEWEYTADSVPQIICLLDANGHIIRANRTIEHWGIGKVVEVRGQSMHQLLHPNCEDPECTLGGFWKRVTAPNAEKSAEFQTEDSFLHRFLHMSFQVHDHPPDKYGIQSSRTAITIAVVEDITPLKHTELELQTLNQGLEQRIQERTLHLADANRRLEREIEEKKRIEVKLENSREQYRQLVHTMNESLVVLDNAGRITYVNQHFAAMLGYPMDEIIGYRFSELVAEPTFTSLEEFSNKHRHGNIANNVLQLRGLGGNSVWVKVSPSVLFDAKGKAASSLVILTDISERIHAEQELRQSSLEIKDLYNNAPCGYHSLDKDGVFLRINQTELEWLGYSREEVVGKMKFIDLLTRSSRRKFRRIFPMVVTQGHVHNLEFEIIRKNGSTFYGLINASAITDQHGDFVSSRSTLYDLTERRMMEQALRNSQHELRMLSIMVMSAQEKERQRIAAELHDGIGQTLSAIKFYLETEMKRHSDESVTQNVPQFQSIIPKIQAAIEEVRNISMNLRPSLLDDLGILATLAWFWREYQAVYAHICIKPKIDILEHEIPTDLKIVIFRIVQEAMNNTAKYGNAGQVDISLKKTESKTIDLIIRDNGLGFDLNTSHYKPGQKRNGGIGLASMRERAEFSGGVFRLDSANGQGTTIRVSWPSQISAAAQSAAGRLRELRS